MNRKREARIKVRGEPTLESPRREDTSIRTLGTNKK